MRFYTLVQNEINSSLCEILDEPWSVFAIDLLYFLAGQHKTGFIPYRIAKKFGYIMIPTPRNYTPHPLSPFTNNMRRALLYGILPPDEMFEKTYDLIVAKGIEEKLAHFVDHVIEAFNDFFEAERTMRDLFFVLLYVGKLATIFHVRGTADATQLAFSLMSNAIIQAAIKVPLNQVFATMDDVAKAVCRGHEQQQETEA